MARHDGFSVHWYKYHCSIVARFYCTQKAKLDTVACPNEICEPSCSPRVCPDLRPLCFSSEGFPTRSWSRRGHSLALCACTLHAMLTRPPSCNLPRKIDSSDATSIRVCYHLRRSGVDRQSSQFDGYRDTTHCLDRSSVPGEVVGLANHEPATLAGALCVEKNAPIRRPDIMQDTVRTIVQRRTCIYEAMTLVFKATSLEVRKAALETQSELPSAAQRHSLLKSNVSAN